MVTQNSSGAAGSRLVYGKDVESFSAKVKNIPVALAFANSSHVKGMRLAEMGCDKDSSNYLAWKLGVFDGIMAFFISSLTTGEMAVHNLVTAEMANMPTDGDNYIKTYMQASLNVLRRLGYWM